MLIFFAYDGFLTLGIEMPMKMNHFTNNEKNGTANSKNPLVAGDHVSMQLSSGKEKENK